MAETDADGRLLRLVQRPVREPFGDALAGGTWHGPKRADRLAQLGQCRDGPLIDTHVCACALQNLVGEWLVGDIHDRHEA